jgi:acyl carrier protein
MALNKKEIDMITINELKGLMLEIGVEQKIVNGLDPMAALSLQGVDSVDCPAFAAALEDRYGINITDEAALKLKTLNDFEKYINQAK